MSKWILALPTTTAVETERRDALQKEVARTIHELSGTTGLGRSGVGHHVDHINLSGAAANPILANIRPLRSVIRKRDR